MHLAPYLTFNGNCREALTFYAELLGGQVGGFMTYAAEMIENVPGATEDHIMHGTIHLGDFMIAGADQFGDQYTPAGNISMLIEIEDLSEAEAKFAALAEGGQVLVPFEETFWADGFGFCTDRFGIMWQINCTGSKAE